MYAAACKNISVEIQDAEVISAISSQKVFHKFQAYQQQFIEIHNIASSNRSATEFSCRIFGSSV